MARPSPRRALLRERWIRHWRLFLRWTDEHSDSRWVFRGLGDPAFGLRPSVGRTAAFDAVQERNLFELFKRRLPEFRSVEGLRDLDILAIAQHHGVPTRLLDWTSNPLIAAYFAVTSPPSPRPGRLLTATGRVSPRGTDVIPDRKRIAARIVATAVRSGRTLQPTDDPFAVAVESFCWPRAVTERITTQGGLFSVHPHPDRDWVAPLSQPRHLFDIPGEMLGFFQRRLFYLGIDGQRIMGGIDGLGSRLAWQYRAKIGMRML